MYRNFKKWLLGDLQPDHWVISNYRKSVSMNDKETRMMRSRDGYIPAYNIQSATDTKHKMIADTEVVTDENDLNQLEPMVESIEEIGEKPIEASAVNGYYNLNQIEEVESDGKVECFIEYGSKGETGFEIKFETV